MHAGREARGAHLDERRSGQQNAQPKQTAHQLVEREGARPFPAGENLRLGNRRAPFYGNANVLEELRVARIARMGIGLAAIAELACDLRTSSAVTSNCKPSTNTG